MILTHNPLNDSVYCTCCGWHFYQWQGEISYWTSPPPIDNPNKYACTDEHRARWPRPKASSDPEEYTEDELAQELNESDPYHYYIAEDRKCAICKEWAPHRITHHVRGYSSLDLIDYYSSALCCQHYKQIFGESDHKDYNEVLLGLNKERIYSNR
jgi:hypothetical protein